MVWVEGCSNVFVDDAGGLEDVGLFEAKEDGAASVGYFGLEGAVALS